MSNIVNFEKVDLSKNIILTGKHTDIQQSLIMVHELKDYSFYLLPEAHIHYSEFDDVITNFMEKHHDQKVVISSQNNEFIEALLKSDYVFQSLTIVNNDKQEKYALRVVDKNKARELMTELGLDLRV